MESQAPSQTKKATTEEKRRYANAYAKVDDALRCFRISLIDLLIEARRLQEKKNADLPARLHADL